MKYCRYCGAQLEDDAIFCDKCGSKLTEKAKKEPSREEATVIEGKIFKCPSCGSNLPSNSATCPYCGAEIRGREASSSIKQFFETIKSVDDNKKKIDLIKTFPVPNTKEDIVEFMLMASSNFDAEHYSESRDNKTVDGAWLAKIELCYQKGKLLFTARSDLQPIENIYQKIQGKIKKGGKKSFMKKWGAAIICGSLLTIGSIVAISFGVASENYIPKPKEGQTVFIEYSGSYFKDENYNDVKVYFESQGFEDVNLNPLHDLITGWVTKEGTVENVSINGDTSFHAKRWYYPTDKVIISYHSF